MAHGRARLGLEHTPSAGAFRSFSLKPLGQRPPHFPGPRESSPPHRAASARSRQALVESLLPAFVAEALELLPPHAWNARPVDHFERCTLVQCDLVIPAPVPSLPLSSLCQSAGQ